MPFGCFTNCLPFFVPSRFAFVVAAYSADVRLLMAFSGRYLSPVLEDGFPDFVRHFCFVHDFRLLCDFANAIIYLVDCIF
jgi:hypothetical protein